MWAALAPGGAQHLLIGEHFSPDNFHTGRLDVVLKAMGLKANRLNRWKLMSVLLDPAFELNGAIAAGAQFVVNYVKDPLDFASCFPTAEHLFPILAGVNAPNAAFCGQNNNILALPDVATFQAEVARLVARIQAYENAGTESVFRIEFAGHGFTLVLRAIGGAHAGMRIELIESLAHSCAIHNSLRYDPFDPAEVCTALTRMASSRHARRLRGADFLGWNGDAIFLHDAGDPGDDDYPLSSYDGQQNAAVGEYYPRTRMKWWCHPLAVNGLQSWMTLGVNRLGALELAFPGRAQGGPPAKRPKT